MQIGAGLIGEFGGYKAKGGGYELFFMASTNYYYHRKTRLCQCLGASVKIVAIDWIGPVTALFLLRSKS